MFCLYGWLCTPRAHGGQKRARDSWKSELLTVVSHRVGAGNSTRTLSLQEQRILLSTEPSLQPCRHIFRVLWSYFFFFPIMNPGFFFHKLIFTDFCIYLFIHPSIRLHGDTPAMVSMEAWGQLFFHHEDSQDQTQVIRLITKQPPSPSSTSHWKCFKLGLFGFSSSLPLLALLLGFFLLSHAIVVGTVSLISFSECSLPGYRDRTDF